jgi:hypothetical protein
MQHGHLTTSSVNNHHQPEPSMAPGQTSEESRTQCFENPEPLGEMEYWYIAGMRYNGTVTWNFIHCRFCEQFPCKMSEEELRAAWKQTRKANETKGPSSVTTPVPSKGLQEVQYWFIAGIRHAAIMSWSRIHEALRGNF